MGLLIVCNAIAIGFETEYKEWRCWDVIENLFLVAFAIELGLKLVIQGPEEVFSCENSDIIWNIFDFIVVSIGIIDVAMDIILQGESGGDYATIFRMIRLMRILRIFRMIRYLKQLYMLAFGFALAAIAVFWVTFLMIFVLYVCAIILVRTVGHVTPEDAHYDFLHLKFGNIAHAMLTLFEIMSSPNLQDYEEIMVERPFFCVFVVGFIIFGSFGMIALLTGVISESMFEKNNMRMEEERMDREQTRKLLVRTCEDWFDEVSTLHGSGSSAQREDVALMLPRIAALFEQEGVDYAGEDLDEMLDIIDCDGSEVIDKNEFRHFIVQMAEGVRPLLLMELYYAVGMVRRRSEQIKEKLVSTLQKVQRSEAEESAQDGPGDAVAEALASLSKKVTGLTGSVEKLDAHMSNVDARIVQVTRGVDRVSNTVSSAKSVAALMNGEDAGPDVGSSTAKVRTKSPGRRR